MKFQSIINNICCDTRIKDGILRLDNVEHVFILQEYLEKAGYSMEEIVNKTSRLFEAGRFPERQAYNKDGILVTFPNKEYRDKAVDKGTHFAENPKKADTTLYAPGETGDLSTADIKTGEEPKEKEDSVPIDKELNKKISGTESEDERTPVEKSQDAVAVQSILTGESPLVNYSVDEAIKFGFYKKGFEWYDGDGNLIGEQIYNENTNRPEIMGEKKSTEKVKLVKKTKEQEEECVGAQMEYWINDEFNNKDTNNSIAKKLVANLKSEGAIGSKSFGNEKCVITNPVFNGLKETSKTDLVFTYANGSIKRCSLKNENYSVCQAQNLEINSVITMMLKLNNEEQKVIDSINSFIMDGLHKDFYTSLKGTVRETFQSTLSEIIKLSKNKKLSEQELNEKAEVIKSIISKNKEYIKNGIFDIDLNKILSVLNNLFTDPIKRKMFMHEMITGKHRWSGDADCIADHIMGWDCSGQYVFHTIDDFINENLYTINFRFRNRGGVRGICLRSDCSVVSEILSEELQKLDEEIDFSFKGILDMIKNVGGDLKDFFMSLYDFIKNGLKEIYSLVLRAINYVKDLSKKGWESFVKGIGFEADGEGYWVFKMP